ncbi:MAG: anaerobic ribonucleoside-triphosphate reductase [Fusobacteriaceae bacterium]
MSNKIIKRNGKKVDFNREKIFVAMSKAFQAMKEKFPKERVDEIIESIEKELKKKELQVEEIQDIVVKKLQNSPFKNVAEHYISYRAVRAQERLKLNEMVISMNEIMEIGSSENSNKDSSLPNVKRDLIAGEYSKHLALKHLPPRVLKAHEMKTIHYHDMDYAGTPMTNCCIFNLKDMLENGTKINNADIEEPKSVEVASTVTSQIVANIAHQQYGGISIGDFNEILAKYAKKNFVKNFKDAIYLLDIEYNNEFGEISSSNVLLREKMKKPFEYAKKKTTKNIYDACQTYEYQTNSISSASQTPFSTIMFTIPTSWESEEIIKSYFEIRKRGLGKEGKLAVFPKINYIVVDGLNLKKGDKYFHLTELASECISKCYYPDILHYSKEDYNKGKTYARMGCRSRVNHDYLENGKPLNYGRFNIGVQTINLVQPALKALEKYKVIDKNKDLKKLKEEYFKFLKEASEIIEEAVVYRFNFSTQLKAEQAPVLFVYGAIARLKNDETIEKICRTDKASISYGYVGIDDAVRLLTGGETIKDQDGHELGLEIMKFLDTEVKRIKIKYNMPLSLYGTPAEALVHNFYKKDLESFSNMMPSWLSERGYYTNSYHFSSELEIDAFEKLKIEAPFIPYSSGGNIDYSEIGFVKNNTQAILELIEYGHEVGIEYQGFNVRNDKCYACKYEGEIKYNFDNNTYTCPQCGNTNAKKLSVIKRTCGYLSNLAERKAITGRMKEIDKRNVHVK